MAIRAATALARRQHGPAILSAARLCLPRTRAYSRETGVVTVDGIELTFLGTGSGQPSRSRNQQAMTMNMCGFTWLFDCGEASQHRMMRTDGYTPATITRIFVSHMHGDHVFGLPGMVCNIAAATHNVEDESARDTAKARSVAAQAPLVIVGPRGLRSFLRATLGNSYAKLGNLRIQVHELVGLQAERRPDLRPPCEVTRALPQELEGQDIEPNQLGTWDIPIHATEPRVSVEAVELDHSVPTVGYVVTEDPRPGKLDADAILPILHSYDVPLPRLREFKRGTPIDLPDGTRPHPRPRPRPRPTPSP